MQILKELFKCLHRKKTRKTAELQPEGAAGVLWQRVGCATLYLHHGCTNYPEL
jgi:hypothetical protein